MDQNVCIKNGRNHQSTRINKGEKMSIQVVRNPFLRQKSRSHAKRGRRGMYTYIYVHIYIYDKSGYPHTQHSMRKIKMRVPEILKLHPKGTYKSLVGK